MSNQLAKESKPVNWHACAIEMALDLLKTSAQGLSAQSAEERLAEYGPNQLPEPKKRHPLVRFLYQFHNLLIYVLIAASAVTAALNHWIDTSVILGVVLVNAIIGFVQEGKAEDALKAIRQMLSPNALVLRNGRRTKIPAAELVPGDLVLLQPGDKVPADLRLLKVKGLLIQESMLTGESIAVEKTIDSIEVEAVLGDRLCLAYSGTLVTQGQGAGIVVATGKQTEIGHISEMVSEVENLTTPLLSQMTQFGRWLTYAVLAIATITFVFGYFAQGYDLDTVFLAAVSLAVAAIPEGLPAIMTITLAIGVQRMAHRNAIIRRLPAVETLGAVNVICSDKTGTLTRNEMTVRLIATVNHLFELSGTGYDPQGEICLSGKPVNADQQTMLIESIRAAVLCNDASLERKDQDWVVNGSPMEGALLIAGMKAGIDTENEVQQYPRCDLIPFESEHRFMATLHQARNDQTTIFLKGAPEQILEMCSHQKTVSNPDSFAIPGMAAELPFATEKQPVNKSYWLSLIEEMALQGMRVLAVAYRSAAHQQERLAFNDVDNGMTMLGLFGLIDPPRKEAVEAVRNCNAAGIRVKMITGDYGSTALAIARQLNLCNVKDVLDGQHLDSMSDKELAREVVNVDVFARVSPEHKLRLITLMQASGLIVAMTGDGVNDAPALKRADVGTAMGKNGTETAKEAAEMVLADDNFASIAHAVEEGRTVYDNLKKAILFILPTNGGEALIILAAIVAGLPYLPLLPVQILWINMVTAVTLALSLAFEPPEPNVMQRPPRKAHEPLLTPSLIWRITFVSVIMMSGTLSLFFWEIERGFSIEHARTVAVNTLVMFEVFYLFNSRYINASVFHWHGFTGNRYVLLAIVCLIVFQLGFTYLQTLQGLFGTTDIDLATWVKITLVSSTVLFLVEAEKYVLRRTTHRNLSKAV